jgi:cytochrome c6
MRPTHLLPALLIAAALVGCGGDGDDDGGNGGGATPTATQPATTETQPRTDTQTVDGGEVFASNCSSCHTLAAAGATGVTGPNLDDLQPDVEQVRNQVINGGGGMPAFEGDLSDEEIDAVSSYVAENAGS